MGTAKQICERLRWLREIPGKVAHDIEGDAINGVSVCSFAWSAQEALSVPLRHMNWVSWWSPDDESLVVQALKDLLEDPAVPKVAHNWLYELFVWRWHYGIRVQGVADDTMLKFHTLYPELEKALDVVASIYSREPYWKDMGDTDSDDQLARYNALDTLVTYEVNEAMEREMTPAHRAFYTHTRDLIDPCLEMSYEGMAFDSTARDKLAASIQQEVFAFQGELDELAGIKPPTFDEVAAKVAFARKLDKCKTWADVLVYSKPSYLKRAELGHLPHASGPLPT